MMRREAVGIVIAILVAASLSVGYLAGIASRSTSIGASTLTSQQTTLSSTTVTAQDAYLEGEVANAYATHVAQLSARDITALAGGYESNATVDWTTGSTTALTPIGFYISPGTFSGAVNIAILWGSTIGKFINFSVSDEHQSIGIKGDVFLVNSTLDFRGWTYCDSSVGSEGTMNGSVVAQDVYEHVSNSSSWFIARESWNFTQFNACSQGTSRSSTTIAGESSTSASLTSSLPTCYETLDTVINPAPEGTVYMKVVTDQGAVITNGTLFVTQDGKTAYDVAHGGGTTANYCIKLSDVNSTGYLQLAANATFITSGHYNMTLMAVYNQGAWYVATIPSIQVHPNSTVYVTVSVPSGAVTVVTTNEGAAPSPRR
jgi:hypothetical protein